MGKRKNRIDVGAPAEALTDNPFAALAAHPVEAVAPLAVEPAPSVPGSATVISQPYRVERTRKGGWPIFFEKRAGGKSATIVRNVSGDTKALLKQLRKRCSAGGVARANEVEVQGDHGDTIRKLLEGNR